jgi:hypothetical protein
LSITKEKLMIRCNLTLACAALLTAFAGCSSKTAVEKSQAASQPSAAGAKYLLSAAPADPQDVTAVLDAAENGQDVVVVGRIGGDHNPWVDGLAAFKLVDRSLAACTDIPGDNCPTPWDYCCVTDQLPGATTFVKVVDEQGEIVPTGAQELLGVSELQTVVIKGKALKDEDGNVTVLASGIFIDPSNPGQVKHADAAHDHDHGDHAHHDHDTSSPDTGNEPSTEPGSEQ